MCQLLNSRKGDVGHILDPFFIRDGWFVIEFPTLLVKAAPRLQKRLRVQVTKTRDVLRLNDDNTCLMTRQQYVMDYCRGEISFVHLEKRAPFLATEMKAQGFDQLSKIRKVMNLYLDD